MEFNKNLDKYPICPIRQDFETDELYDQARRKYRKEYQYHQKKLFKEGKDVYNDDYHAARHEYLRRLKAHKLSE